MEFARPIQRLGRKLMTEALLAATLLGGTGLAQTKPGAEPHHSHAVASQAADLDAGEKQLASALQDAYGKDVEISWYSDPEEVKAHPQRQHFMSELAKDCQRMGLPTTPIVLIVGPAPGVDGVIPTTNIESISGTVVKGLGPVLLYRNGVFGGEKSLLTENEALAGAVHEEWHMKKWYERGGALPEPDDLTARHHRFSHQRNLALAAQARAEEKAGDLKAVEFGRGRDFLSMSDKLTAQIKKDFTAQPAMYGGLPGESYDDFWKRVAPVANHPSDAEERATLVKAIDAYEHPHAAPVKTPRMAGH